MSVKRAITGFRGIALAPVTTDTLTSYVTEPGAALQYAGKMSHSVKESKKDLYYDDVFYGQIRDVSGEDVEIRVAEVPMSQLQTLGLGTYDETTNSFEGNFAITGKSFALRWVADTLSGLPFYFNYRVFELTAIRFDAFTTKTDSGAVCEVILLGVFKKPQLTTITPWAMMQLAEDKSNAAACDAFLTAVETKPAA